MRLLFLFSILFSPFANADEFYCGHIGRTPPDSSGEYVEDESSVRFTSHGETYVLTLSNHRARKSADGKTLKVWSMQSPMIFAGLSCVMDLTRFNCQTPDKSLNPLVVHAQVIQGTSELKREQVIPSIVHFGFEGNMAETIQNNFSTDFVSSLCEWRNY